MQNVAANAQRLMNSGLYDARDCCLCRRSHLALKAAPSSAPCLVCATALRAHRAPPSSPRWSPLFLAHVQREFELAARALVRGEVIALDTSVPRKNSQAA